MAGPIVQYCKMFVEGWDKLPEEMSAAPFEEWAYTASFVRKDGVHLMCSVKQRDTSVPIIHVSLGPIYSYRPDLTRDELLKHIDSETATVLQLFFGDRSFHKQPPDPRRRDIKHYFSPLKD